MTSLSTLAASQRPDADYPLGIFEGAVVLSSRAKNRNDIGPF